ncbi:27846_t:CDS:2, partial [Racocetra persica]
TSIQRFLKGVPLSELHPSLNNRSKIEHMIATKRYAKHPYGQDIMGIANMLLKQKQDNNNNPYIRSISLVFARAFTILQIANTYQKLFEELFICVKQDCGHFVEFQHIHGCGIGCILADEYYGQALDKFYINFCYS